MTQNSDRKTCVDRSRTLAVMQRDVDRWIQGIGGGYFSELTNMCLLTEETGELARVIARVYGDQVAKRGDLHDPNDVKASIREEIADVLWVLTCLANQTGISLEEAFAETLNKKTRRDSNRFCGRNRGESS